LTSYPKKNFFRVLTSVGEINILIIGNNDSLLNQVISYIRAQRNDIFIFDVTSTNGRDFIDPLGNNRLAQVILIDNIDKLRKNYLDGLNGYLNDRKLKTSQPTSFEMKNVKVFATAKNLEKFSPQLRSLFMIYILLS
jgi:hypothetical protein